MIVLPGHHSRSDFSVSKQLRFFPCFVYVAVRYKFGYVILEVGNWLIAANGGVILHTLCMLNKYLL